MRRTDSCELGEDLDQGAVYESRSPLRDCEHDSPAWDGDGLLSTDCGTNLIILMTDPVVVGAVEVQLLEDLHPVFIAVVLNQPDNDVSIVCFSQKFMPNIPSRALR